MAMGTPVKKWLCLGVQDKQTYWGTVGFARMSVWNRALRAAEILQLFNDGGDPRQVSLYKGSVVILR